MRLGAEDQEWLGQLLDRSLSQAETRLDQKLAALEERLKAYARSESERVETSLLAEFQKWASPVDSRLHGYGKLISALEENLYLLTGRVKAIEDLLPRQ
jgi:hypothetical protein